MTQFKDSITKYSGGVLVPLIVLLAGAAIFFVLLPKYKDVKAARQTVEENKSFVMSREEQLRSLQVLLDDYEKKKAKLQPIDESVPTAPKIPELLGNIDILASQSGLLISGIEISPAPTLTTVSAGQSVGQVKKTEELLSGTEGIMVMLIDLKLTGKYTSLKAFLGNLEQNLRIMDTQVVAVDEADDETGDQEYSLKIHTYYQKDAE